MTSPLTPIPALPWDYVDADGIRLQIDRGPEGEAVLRYSGPTPVGDITLTVGVVPAADLPGFAAAILAGSTARVIDLPEADEIREEDGKLVCGDGPERCWADPGENPNWHWHHVANAMALAVELEAHAATPAHDPAEVDALKKAMAHRWGGYGVVASKDYDQAARDFLDALDRVRGADR